jgi:hypothetical protein
MVERSITAIIPTMWKSKNINRILTDLYGWYLIDKVILIDNNSAETPDDFPKDDKLIYVKPNKNIYVNPAWNLGVHMATTENIFILNDDIHFQYSEVHNFLMEVTGKWGKKFEDLGFIGMHSINYVGGGNYMTIEPYDNTTNTGGWGCFIMFAKKHWVDIPEQLKIWYGDNFIQALAYGRGIAVSQFRGLTMTKSEMSVTSDDMSVRDVRDNDTIEWNKLLNNK